jgi:Nif-specific regulatory protein
LLLAAHDATDTGPFLKIALPLIQVALDADFVALHAAGQGQFRQLASSGNHQAAPPQLLSEALDREQLIVFGQWVAAPLPGPKSSELLLLHCGQSASIRRAPIESLAGALAAALASIRQRLRLASRLARLDTILQIAGQWNQMREMEPLLVAIAQAACRLLKADRASIFLWDRHSHTLVAKPALGVKKGELRIRDDAGIVGQVVQTGESRRVNRGSSARDIDRTIDQQLGYVTHSLLCVPLAGRGGQRFGAFEMINKLEGDFTDEDEEALRELAAHAAVALENARDREALLRSQQQIVDQAASGVELIGESPAIAALQSTLRRVADTDLAILILGENGTGKEVVARSIHYQSRRRNQPFIAVNCAAIAETLLESELFGHEKGAFTDAREARPGKFELASGGTLFLDEIAELSPAGQAKLLRVLEEKVVVRVGGSLPIHTDARVLAATNRNLAEMVGARKFREDLFFRLNVVSIELPPLRQRGRDILLLAGHFLEQFSRRIGRQTPRLSDAAQRRLLEHPWPGNVRELRNLMERLAYLSPADTIEANDLAFILAPTRGGPALVPLDLPLSQATDRFQSEYIKQAIELAGGNMSEAAQRLGLHRSNLYRKMRQLGMGEIGSSG